MGSDSDSEESASNMLCSGYDDPECDPYRSDIILWIIQFYGFLQKTISSTHIINKTGPGMSLTKCKPLYTKQMLLFFFS